MLEIDLPHAEKEEIEVTACGDELLLRVRDARRRIALPASLAGRGVEGVRLAKGVLEVGLRALRFEALLGVSADRRRSGVVVGSTHPPGDRGAAAHAGGVG